MKRTRELCIWGKAMSENSKRIESFIDYVQSGKNGIKLHGYQKELLGNRFGGVDLAKVKDRTVIINNLKRRNALGYRPSMVIFDEFAF